VHGLSETYLKPNLKHLKNALFVQLFKRLKCKIVLTNYRFLFIPHFSEIGVSDLYSSQPDFVREYFNIPLGLVTRIEKQHIT
jgi:hypothetical protein